MRVFIFCVATEIAAMPKMPKIYFLRFFDRLFVCLDLDRLGLFFPPFSARFMPRLSDLSLLSTNLTEKLPRPPLSPFCVPVTYVLEGRLICVPEDAHTHTHTQTLLPLPGLEWRCVTLVSFKCSSIRAQKCECFLFACPAETAPTLH